MDKTEWACPKCGALANEHGTGRCVDRLELDQCSGFLCECEGVSDDPCHGESLAKPCHNAWCYHCGFGGTFPDSPAKWPKWAKTAFAEGWIPPKGWQP